eukprot:523771-Rhodomonas_salina.1
MAGCRASWFDGTSARLPISGPEYAVQRKAPESSQGTKRGYEIAQNTQWRGRDIVKSWPAFGGKQTNCGTLSRGGA